MLTRYAWAHIGLNINKLKQSGLEKHQKLL